MSDELFRQYYISEIENFKTSEAIYRPMTLFGILWLVLAIIGANCFLCVDRVYPDNSPRDQVAMHDGARKC